MARRKSEIDMARVKAELAKAGATASQIKELTSNLADNVKLTALEKERKVLKKAIDKIDAQITKITGAKTVAAPATKKRGRPAKTKQVSADKVLTYLSKNSGSALRREEIAVGMKVDSKSLVSALSTLVEEKKVKRAGQRRGTTYSA